MQFFFSFFFSFLPSLCGLFFFFPPPHPPSLGLYVLYFTHKPRTAKLFNGVCKEEVKKKISIGFLYVYICIR